MWWPLPIKSLIIISHLYHFLWNHSPKSSTFPRLSASDCGRSRMLCNSKTMCELYQWHSLPSSILCAPSSKWKQQCCQICSASSEMKATTSPTSSASCQVAAWLHEADSRQCTQMAQQPLPWKSETTQRVSGSWQSLNSSLFQSGSYGIPPNEETSSNWKSVSNVFQANSFWILQEWVCIRKRKTQ